MDTSNSLIIIRLMEDYTNIIDVADDGGCPSEGIWFTCQIQFCW